jgi:hypothetical protein
MQRCGGTRFTISHRYLALLHALMLTATPQNTSWLGVKSKGGFNENKKEVKKEEK